MRKFSTSATSLGKTAVSIVPPVHHLIKFKKSQLSPRARLPKSWITSAGFKPQVTTHDRVRQHYLDTIESDMLLIGYHHGEQRIQGHKPRPRPNETPYEVFQPMRAPFGQTQATKDIKPRTWKNIPQIHSISLNCFVREATGNHDLAIAAKLMLQQITGEKPSTVYAKTNVPKWYLRPGMPVGAKITIKGESMSQFISTMTELVLPRSKTFRQISSNCGDHSGNLAFKLTAHDMTLFPELESSLELWPETFAVDVQIKTTAQTDKEARTLLSGFGFPVGPEKK